MDAEKKEGGDAEKKEEGSGPEQKPEDATTEDDPRRYYFEYSGPRSNKIC